jgi:hypothetical protein
MPQARRAQQGDLPRAFVENFNLNLADRQCVKSGSATKISRLTDWGGSLRYAVARQPVEGPDEHTLPGTCDGCKMRNLAQGIPRTDGGVIHSCARESVESVECTAVIALAEADDPD